jgi:hypothetical protein
MKRSHLEGERFDARELSDASFTAYMFAASAGMIWDLATGHVSAFDRMLSNISDDEGETQRPVRAAAPTRLAGVGNSTRSRNSNSTARGMLTDA